jgi:hypothetical protein
MEGSNENKEELNQQHKEFISLSAYNINDLFASSKYEVPLEFNLLSIDVDFDDYWIWQAVDDAKYKPRILIIEYKISKLGSSTERQHGGESQVSQSMDRYRLLLGASYQALKQLGQDKGYMLVFGESMGVNLFFFGENRSASVWSWFGAQR